MANATVKTYIASNRPEFLVSARGKRMILFTIDWPLVVATFDLTVYLGRGGGGGGHVINLIVVVIVVVCGRAV